MFKVGDRVIVTRTSIPRFRSKIGTIKGIGTAVATVIMDDGVTANFFTHRLDHLREENEI